MRHNFFTANACQLPKTHENVGRNGGIRIIGFLEKNPEHRECIRLDEALCRTDKERQQPGAFLAITPELYVSLPQR
jgi:hypothetical protein